MYPTQAHLIYKANILTDIKEDNLQTIILEEFSAPFTSLDRSCRQKKIRKQGFKHHIFN